MEKKLWSNAEVVELGVESTKEEDQTPQGPLTPYHCPWCNDGFMTQWGLEEHKKCCKKKPASPGFGPDGDVTPGVDAPPPLS